MEKAKIIAMVAVISVFAAGFVYAYANSSVIGAQVTVPAVCFVSLNSSSINFGSVGPGTDTGATNQAVTVTNNGNTAATTTTIEGTGWVSGSDTMVVGQTEYGVSGFTYGAGTALTASPVALTGGNLAAAASLTTYYGVAVPSAQAAGTYDQNITITMNC